MLFSLYPGPEERCSI